jgi:Tol biopolymer transport system component
VNAGAAIAIILAASAVLPGATEAASDTGGRSATSDAAPPAPVGSHVRILRLDVGELRSLSDRLLPAWPRDIRLAPDRHRLVYVGSGADASAGAEQRMWVVDVHGGRTRALGPPGTRLEDPSWSPDGRSIVYVDEAGLSIVDVRSGVVRHLDRVRGGRLWLPSFRPDGKAILYTRVADHGHRLELWLAPVRGGTPRRLMRDAAFGSWSPDGTRIAVRRFGRAVRPGLIWPFRIGRLDLLDADGRRVRTLLHSRGSMMAPLDWSPVRPDWSPDGTRIAYASYPSWDSPLHVLDLGSHHVTHVGCGSAPVWLDVRTLLLERAEPCRTSSTKRFDLAGLVDKE